MIFTVSEIDILIYQQHQKPNLHVPSFKDQVYMMTADRSFFVLFSMSYHAKDKTWIFNVRIDRYDGVDRHFSNDCDP